MRLSNALRGLVAFVLAVSFLTASSPASTYADSDNQTSSDNTTAGQAPSADFTADQTSTYVNTDIQFTDASTGNPTSWAWDFDNNGTTDSTEQNPIYQYSDAGTYTVKLTVSNAYGSDSQTKINYITVVEAPATQTQSTPLTTGAPLAEVSPMSTATTNLVPNAAGSSTSLSRFGAGLTANWQACVTDDGDTSYVYRTNSSYATDLYNLTDVTSPPSCTIASVTVYIRARAASTPSQASAYTDIRTGTTTYAGTPITLTTSYATYSTTYMTNPSTGLAWTWTDINSLQAGVSLRRPTATSAQSRVTAVWVVVDYGPTANFSASPTSGCAPVSVICTDNSTNGPTSWSWSFPGGNPSTATGQGPFTIIYSNAGSYDVTLTVSNSCGSDTKTQTGYIIVNPTPTVTISGNPNRCGGTSTTLTANPSGGTTPYTYLWYPGGATTPTVTASTTDNYTVTVTDSHGCQGRAKTVVTANPALSVTLAGSTSFCQGSSTTLTANASGGTQPYTYNWSASTAPGSYNGNIYTATGAGTVAVTVTDSAHCRGVVVSDTNTQVTQGNIAGATYPYNAVLAWLPPAGVAPGTWWSSLTGYSLGYPNNAAQWIWESYRVIHPIDGDIVYFQRSFTIPGTPTGATIYITCDNGYQVSINGNLLGSAQLLTGWGPGHLTDAYVPSSGWQSVESWSVPSNWLVSGTNTLSITGVNEYSGPLDGVANGTVDSNPGAIIYEMVYEYTSNCGCTASGSVSVTTVPSPTANFSAAPLTGIAPLTVNFTDNSTGATSWAWDFNSDNITESTLRNPSYIYSAAGTYTVKLGVTNASGCSDNKTMSNYITVSPPPTAPTVNSIEIYDSPALNNPVSLSNPMSPLTTYYAKVSIITNGQQLNQLQTVQVTIFYNSSGSDNMTAPTSSNTQTCAILTWTAASDNWTIAPSGGGTTWSLLNGSCSHPSDLTTTTGDWKFAFTPGKVATESVSPADWDAQGKATNKSSLSGEAYVRHKGMNFYSEITVTGSVNWGNVPLGLTFQNATYNPRPASDNISINYIANGNYASDIKSTDWTSGSETVALDETGGNPPTSASQFALEASYHNVASDNVTVKKATYTPMYSAGTITPEAGTTFANNRLWLSLSATGILPAIYSGDIHYQIAKR